MSMRFDTHKEHNQYNYAIQQLSKRNQRLLYDPSTDEYSILCGNTGTELATFDDLIELLHDPDYKDAPNPYQQADYLEDCTIQFLRTPNDNNAIEALKDACETMINTLKTKETE